MAYNINDKVKIKETRYTGKVLSKRSLLTSLFGLIPRYEVGITLQNSCLKGRDVEMKKFYYGRSLEALSQAEQVFNKIKKDLGNKVETK